MLPKKLLYLILMLLLLIPSVSASHKEPECGITNLASCVVEKFFEFVVDVLNAPLQPLLWLAEKFLSEPVSLQLFAPIWAIMVYVVSLFYALLLLYAGLRFMVSGHDVAMREDAKSWLRNIFLMVIFIQASFFIYSLVVQISALLTAGVLGLVGEEFFVLTADNLGNIGTELVFYLMYLTQLLIAVLLLLLRYVIVALGVVLMPFAIFFYFIPPLSAFGRMILNFLGVVIFMTFFDALIFLVCSQLLSIALFANIKILVMTAAFALANLMMLLMMFFSLIKAVFKEGAGIAKVLVRSRVMGMMK